MGGGDFTGNGSVEWNVKGDNVRNPQNPGSVPRGPRGQQHSGVDETPDGPVQYFTLSIKLPKDAGERAKFIGALGAQLQDGRNTLSVELPIEDKDHGGPTVRQIAIEWPSRQSPAV